MRTVPLLNLADVHRPLHDELRLAMERVLDSNQFIMGPDVGELECAIAGYSGVKHAIGCASGSDAIALALMGLGIGPGDHVLVPSFSFFATAGYVSKVGATPVFADVEPKTFNLDPALLEAKLATDPRIRAIMPVHLFGATADMDPILAVADRYGIPVIEDGAQSIGAAYKGRPAQSIGKVGCLSFFPTKNLGAAGDGGMVTTNDDAVAERIRALRIHGSRQKYIHEMVGINSRLDSLQAAILRVKLPHLDTWTSARIDNAAYYQQVLADLEEISLPVQASYQTRHIWNQFTIRATDRDGLKAFLNSRGVGSEIYYPVPLHLQECFRELGYAAGDLPGSEKASGEVLSLPVHPGLSSADREYVADSVRLFYRQP